MGTGQPGQLGLGEQLERILLTTGVAASATANAVDSTRPAVRACTSCAETAGAWPSPSGWCRR